MEHYKAGCKYAHIDFGISNKKYAGTSVAGPLAGFYLINWCGTDFGD